MRALLERLAVGTKRKPVPVDIVVCHDATGSMQPCLSAILNNFEVFLRGVEGHGRVDMRLKLIAYRDLHDSLQPGPPWFVGEFTRAPADFLSQVRAITAAGGGVAGTGESTLDALFLAARSKFRPDDRRRLLLPT